MKLHHIIEQHWQKPNPILRVLLAPLTRIFAYMVARRRAQYVSGKRMAQRLPVAVVVVGNLHAGGTGKTPITAALVKAWQAHGIHVGIISRGYGRKSKQIHVLNANSHADDAGDEPLLLFRQTHAPVAVGAKRIDAARALLAHHPDVQLLVCDDGLQHYDLARDVEICVFPATDIGQNHLDVLPNGALREPLSRLASVDFVVFSHANEATQRQQTLVPSDKAFISQTHATAPYRLGNRQDILHASNVVSDARCIAIAGIAKPQRFFDTLTQMGFTLHQTHILPDHAPLCVQHLPDADYIFITEKDAVKLPDDAPKNIWVLPIVAEIAPDLAKAVWEKIHQS